MRRLFCVVVPMLVALLLFPATSGATVPPANDDLAGATDILALPYRARIDISEASVSEEDPDCFGNSRSLWYKVTPDTDMRIFARIRRAQFRAFLGVFTGSAGSLTEVFCERYGIPVWEATAGTTYYIRVSSKRRVGEGRAIVVVGEAPPPLEIAVEVDPNGVIDSETEQVTITGTITCSREDEVYYSGTLRQEGSDRRFIQGYFYGEVEECGPEPTAFTHTFFGDGTYEAGKASLETYTYTYDRFGSVEARDVALIQLTRT